MSREEVAKLTNIMARTFSNYIPHEKGEPVEVYKQKLTDKIDTNFFYLEEYEYHKIAAALKQFVLTEDKGFAPSIGQLISIAYAPKSTGMNELAAWGRVRKAICNANYHADEEFGRLPEEVQKAVGSPEQLRIWANTDEQKVDTVIASNFMRAYKTEQQRAREWNMLPGSIKNLIAGSSIKSIEG